MRHYHMFTVYMVIISAFIVRSHIVSSYGMFKVRSILSSTAQNHTKLAVLDETMRLGVMG
jgi:hypothetical protein